MMNLLDNPNDVGMLSLGLRLLSTPGKFGQALGTAGLGAMGDMQQAKQAQAQAKQRALQEQMQMMQVEDLRRKQADQEQQRKQQEAVRAAYAAAIESPAQQAMAGGGGPTVANAQAMQGVSPRLNQQKLIEQLMQADPLMAAQMLTPKEVEIKEFREIRMPDGSVQVVGFGKDGKPVNTGQTPFKPMERQNMGGYLGGIDTITGKLTNLGKMTQSPDSAASIAVQLRGQNMTDARAREANANRGANPRSGPMSVAMQKELIESDDAVQAAAGVVGSLQAALTQNNAAYSGYMAKGRAMLRSNLPGQSAGADATIDIDNLMTGQGLESLKSIFGAAPTEGERKILMDMQASVDKTPAQRKAIMERAIGAANRRASYAARKAQAIRDGSYLTDGIALPPAPTPAATNNAVRKYNPATGRIE